ncbi:MAG: NAD(P)/FAD-dependent oxidoreductase [Candidatus Omnitrophica bacterium]|nr:NAD(P)/FAD-dependent oxidoreductase [Candidatus Omnitrophota bacterium]
MKKNKFEVIIIGAGIGGLICANYLAKKGVKVLIVEKNPNAGGYCRSFKIRDYFFDMCVHSLGGFSKKSKIYEIFKDLNMKNLDLIRINPSDTVITPDLKMEFHNELRTTINGLIKLFPKEKKNIALFFKNFVLAKDLRSVSRCHKKSFRQILDESFEDERLKKIFSIFVIGNMGVSPFEASAFSSCKHIDQFIIDGGYYPKKGMQVFANILARKFQEYGGKVLFSKEATKIVVKNNSVQGLELDRKMHFDADFIVSDADARSTLFNLIGKRFLKKSLINKVNLMKESSSLFVVYYGLKKNSLRVLQDRVNTWFILEYDFEQTAEKNKNNNFKIKWLMIRPNYRSRNLTAFIRVDFKSHSFWLKNKKKYIEYITKIINNIDSRILNDVEYVNCATPSLFNRWTLNSKGAAYGWASTKGQFMVPEFLRDKIVKNLFFCGHWSSFGPGVPGVSISGERVAKIILDRIHKERK